jgi:hypothetical protein
MARFPGFFRYCPCPQQHSSANSRQGAQSPAARGGLEPRGNRRAGAGAPGIPRAQQSTTTTARSFPSNKMTAESLTKRPRQGNKREADCAHWRALGDGLFPVWGGNFFLATSFFADVEHVYLTQLRRDVSCRRDRGRLAKRSNERVTGVRAEACVAAVASRVATLATNAPT